MSLDFLNNLKESISNGGLSDLTNEVKSFLEEISSSLSKNEDEELDIVTKITSEENVSLASKNSIMKARDEILKEYAEATEEKGDLYFIFNKIEGTDSYRVIQMGENTDKTIQVSKDELPEGIKLNDVVRLNSGEYELDEEVTKEVQAKIYEKAEEILEEQNQKLEEYRQEGHIYVVTEDTNGRIFLWDTTSKPDNEIEEIDFPEELKDKAKEGNKFIYENGTYKEYIEDNK